VTPKLRHADEMRQSIPGNNTEVPEAYRDTREKAMQLAKDHITEA
jgi:hypothetical protein